MQYRQTALRSAEPYIIQHADRWCELSIGDTGAQWSEARNMVDWANAVVFDILGDLLYAKSYDIKEPGPNEQKYIPNFITQFVATGHPVSDHSLFSYMKHTICFLHLLQDNDWRRFNSTAALLE